MEPEVLDGWYVVAGGIGFVFGVLFAIAVAGIVPG